MNKDIFYGLMGNISSVLANVLLMPIYIHELGAGSFGIISLVSTIMAVFVIFDAGTGIATMREISLHKNAKNNFTYISNIVLTLERIYLLISVAIGSIIIFGSSYLANDWFKSNDVSIANLSLSLKLIGLIVVFKWPIGLFSNVLTAIGAILLVNKIKFVLSVLQVIISLLVLIVFDFDIIQFLLFLAVFHSVYLGTIAYITWKKNGLNRVQAKWDSEALKNIGKFAFGASFFSIVGVLFTVTDKFFVSKYFTLELFGLYTVISTLGFGATQVIYPVTTALFKQYSFYYFRSKVDVSNFRYRYAFHLLSVFILTFTVFCITFQDIILLLWTQDLKTVEGLRNVGTPFLLGILFYTWHNVAIIPLTIRGAVKQLNLVYGCCWLFFTLILWLLLQYENSLRLVATAWCVSSVMLFFGAKFALFSQNGFFRNKIAVIRYLLIDFVRPVLVSMVIFGVLFSVKTHFNLSGFNKGTQLVWLGGIFVLSTGVQVLGSGLVMKYLIDRVVVYKKYRSDRAVPNNATR